MIIYHSREYNTCHVAKVKYFAFQCDIFYLLGWIWILFLFFLTDNSLYIKFYSQIISDIYITISRFMKNGFEFSQKPFVNPNLSLEYFFFSDFNVANRWISFFCFFRLKDSKSSISPWPYNRLVHVWVDLHITLFFSHYLSLNIYKWCANDLLLSFLKPFVFPYRRCRHHGTEMKETELRHAVSLISSFWFNRDGMAGLSKNTVE